MNKNQLLCLFELHHTLKRVEDYILLLANEKCVNIQGLL